jgi:hypothetical protein
MKHLIKICDVPNYKELRDELYAYEVHSQWSTKRAKIMEQQHTLCITFRTANTHLTSRQCMDAERDFLSKENYPFFTRTYSFLEKFARERNATLARAMIVSLEPHKEVYEHYDAGEYYKTRDRYHLVLESDGSEMHSGDEVKTFYEGELFWFDNKAYHRAVNNSDKRRVHIIFDVLPGKSIFIDMQHRLEKWLALQASKVQSGN